MLISCYNCADILYSSFFSLHCLLPSSSSSFPHSSSFPLYSPAFFFLSSFCLCLPLRYYTLPRPGIASPLPPSCSATASAASSPPTPTCSIRSTCHPPSRCRTVRSPRHTRDPAPCSSATPNSRWSSTASRWGRRPTGPSTTVTWLTWEEVGAWEGWGWEGVEWEEAARSRRAVTRASVQPTPAATGAWRAPRQRTARWWVTTPAQHSFYTSTAITRGWGGRGAGRSSSRANQKAQ